MNCLKFLLEIAEKGCATQGMQCQKDDEKEIVYYLEV